MRNSAATPIIPWLGGKRRLASQLLDMFPPHTCYVEAFCGGAALYFLRPEPAKVEGLRMRRLEIRYSVGNRRGGRAKARELAITNYDP